MRSFVTATVVAAAAGTLVFAGCSSSDSGSDASSSPSASDSGHSHASASHEDQISFALAEQGGSGQEGIAIAYPSGDNLTVMTVAMQGGPAAGGAAESAVIHKGTCSAERHRDADAE
ncbi:MAG: hypothetical protein KDC39_03915 [Actinobacteria bacterium]|nr:hypothetical protein [Actinomycetota bacterium]